MLSIVKGIELHAEDLIDFIEKKENIKFIKYPSSNKLRKSANRGINYSLSTINYKKKVAQNGRYTE